MGNVSSQSASVMPAAAVASNAGAAASDLPAGFGHSCSNNSIPNRGPGASQAAAGPTAMAASAASCVADASTAAGRHTKQHRVLEAKLQRHMDCEDRRVKELTEGVLYDLLPAALDVMLPNCEDPLQELDADRCRAVAAAALAVSALMNAPPGFLEFLLCIPWRQLPQLYPAVSGTAEQQHSEKLLAHLAVDEQERKLLVNMPIHVKLVRPVLEFMYSPEHADSVPPLLRPQHQVGSSCKQQGAAGSSHSAACTASTFLIDTAAALLDGATSLHCAAVRGNPAGVHHLLQCGADPTLRTAAGELPLQLVPVCGCINKQSGLRQCNCLSVAEQEVWECRSRLARTLVAKRCLSCFHVGLMSFLRLAWLCLLTFLGLLMGSSTLQRPAIQSHMQRQREQRQQAAHARAAALLSRMRQEASQGSGYLSTAKHKTGYRQHAAEPPQNRRDSIDSSICDCSQRGAVEESCSTKHSYSSGRHDHHVASVAVHSEIDLDVGPQEPLGPATPSAAAEAVGPQAAAFVQDQFDNIEDDVIQHSIPAIHQGQQPAAEQLQQQLHSTGLHTDSTTAEHSSQQLEGLSEPDDNTVIELAFKCYVRAVHALQNLDLRGGITPQLLADGLSSIGADAAAAESAADGLAGAPAAAAAAGLAAGDANQGFSGVGDASKQPRQQQQLLTVPEDEQAELYCCWAESVLLKFNACNCPGCTALAVQAIRMAHIAIARLYGRMHQLQQQLPQRWRAVGHFLSRVVYAHIALLCQTEARMSPSKASVWQAQQCLHEWDGLAASGLLQSPQGSQDSKLAVEDDTHMVDALRLWSRTAESDLIIAEALLGSSLGPSSTLAEALSAAFVADDDPQQDTEAAGLAAGSMQGSSSTSCLPALARPVTAALLDQLQAARGLATCPSPPVKLLAAQVAEAAARELSAAAKLKEVLASRAAPTNARGAAALADAIAAAEPFSSLGADVAAARMLHQQCCEKAAAASRLQCVVDQVVQLTSRVSSCSNAASSAADAAGAKGCFVNGVALPVLGFDCSSWERYIATLESAVNEAKDANVNVVKARKLIKELQAQLSAAEAAAQLQSCVDKRPCGSAALRSAISKAEAAAAAVSGAAGSTATSRSSMIGSGGRSAYGSAAVVGGGGCAVFNELLVQRVQSAKKRLEVERASEALHKAVLAHRSLADLPKLEAAILNARKVGAEELCPDDYKAASELRARLTSAAKVKQQLDSAVKALETAAAAGPASKGGKSQEELADPVEAAIREAGRWSDLLPGEAARAADALEAWRSSSACEAKLTRALRDGSSSAQLSRLVMDAAAAGVKVASARRILKLQQLLEQAMSAADDSSSVSSTARTQLAAKLEAAEQGGVAAVVLDPARKLLRKLAASEARSALEAALKPHGDWSATERMATLQAALDRSERLLGMSVPELMQQHQQQVAEQQQGELLAGSGPAGEELLNGGSQLAANCNGVHHQTAAEAQLPTSPAAISLQSFSRSSKARFLQRSDSVASSSAASEASTASAATGSTHAYSRDGGGPSLSHCSSFNNSSDVLAGVCELAARAWELLRQNQKQMDEINRERAEQERVRKELKERERQERQCAEAERAERSKAEKERLAAERKQARTKAAAERTRNLAALWGSARNQKAGKAAVSVADGQTADSGVGTSSQSGSAGSSPRPATAPQPKSAAASPAKAAVPAQGSIRSADSANRRDSPCDLVPSQQLQQLDVDSCHAAGHMRTDSYDLLSDVSSKLGREVLELLDLHDHQQDIDATGSAQPQHAPVRSRYSLDDVSSLSQNTDAVSTGLGLGWQRASASWQGSLSTADAAEQQGTASAQQFGSVSGSSSHPATPRFGLIDLGGASWGVERSSGSFTKLSQLSPTAAAGTPATAGLQPQELTAQQGYLGTQVAMGGTTFQPTGLWNSALGLGSVGDTAALPPLAPRTGQLSRLSHPGISHRSPTDQGGSSSSPCQVEPGLLHYGAVHGLVHHQQQQLHHAVRAVELPATGALGQRYPMHAGLVQQPMVGGGDQQYTDYSSAAGDLALLSRGVQGLQSPHQQPHHAAAATQAIHSTASVALALSPASSAGLADGLGSFAISSTLAQQYQQSQLLHQHQHLLQMPQSQQHQLMLQPVQQLQPGLAGASTLSVVPAAAAMAPAVSTPATNVGQYSSSFAFGSHHLPAFVNGSSSILGRAYSHDGVRNSKSGAATLSATVVLREPAETGDADSASEVDPVRNLPDDLNFSPPSPGPAGRLLGRDT